MVLTTLEEEQAPDEARYLLERSSVEQPETASRAIIELVTTIKKTRVYREIKEEGRLEGERSLILCQLTRLLGELPQQVPQRVETLYLEQLENLGCCTVRFY